MGGDCRRHPSGSFRMKSGTDRGPCFPALFAEFREMRFRLLWRGSRGGFLAKDFHRRCYGHTSTLKFVKDTVGTIFGGFTPVMLESTNPIRDGANCHKSDRSLKSFILSRKNFGNFRATKFALRVGKKDEAIYCSSEPGPGLCDIGVDDWHATTGCSSANSTSISLGTFFTGSGYFSGKVRSF
jgi:hypothetical protein